MMPNERETVLVVGGDLLGRTRIEEAVSRSGFTPLSLGANKLSEVDFSQARAVFADVDDDAILDWVTEAKAPGDLLRVGYFAHVDRSRAERVKAAGWQAMPRGRLFRELPQLLGSL